MTFEWFSCPVCKMNHPWDVNEVGARPCPSAKAVAATGKTGVRMLEESGIIERGLSERDRQWDKAGGDRGVRAELGKERR